MATDVAFLTAYRRDGSLIRLKRNEAFFHVFIKHDELWYNAAPGKKVEGVKNFRDAGFRYFTITILRKTEHKFPYERLAPFLGLPYDYGFSWSDEAIYCSELIAKILDISPGPMYFDPTIWQKKYWKLNGRPGISPDQVFYKLLDRGFKLHQVLPTESHDRIREGS